MSVLGNLGGALDGTHILPQSSLSLVTVLASLIGISHHTTRPVTDMSISRITIVTFRGRIGRWQEVVWWGGAGRGSYCSHVNSRFQTLLPTRICK